MDEYDHETEAYDLLNITHRYLRTNQEKPKTRDIARKLFDTRNLSSEQLDQVLDTLKALDSISFLQASDLHPDIDIDTRWSLDRSGRDFLRNASLTNQLDLNRKQQRKSAAVETLFTIALLAFASIQVITSVGTVPESLKPVFIWSSILLTLGVLGAAWRIGGENLVKAWNKELDRG